MTSLSLPRSIRRPSLPSNALRIGTAYLAFTGLGLSGGLLGVAVPAIEQTFAVTHSTLGLLLLATVMGYVPLSLLSGFLTARLGVGRLLSLGSLLLSASLAGYATAPAWWVFVAAGFCHGIAAGCIGAGVNIYATRYLSLRHINWLHASFGIGMTLSPPLMTGIQMAGSSWRYGYGITACGLAGLAIWCILARAGWQPLERATTAAPGTSPATLRATLTHPTTWLLVALFFIYPIEDVVGKWAFSLFTSGRDVAPATAGFWMTGYWGSFTLSRILAGVLVEQLGMPRLLRGSTLALVLGASLIWLPNHPQLNLVGLTLMGIALAPLYPMLMAQTQRYLGTARAPHAIGLQASAASLGGAVLPGLAGMLAEHVGLESVASYIVGLTLLFLLLHETLRRSK